jgi:hypothetical protein
MPRATTIDPDVRALRERAAEHRRDARDYARDAKEAADPNLRRILANCANHATELARDLSQRADQMRHVPIRGAR